MRLIKLHNGMKAQVDDWNYERVSALQWRARRDRKNGLWYAEAQVKYNGHWSALGMHRFIMEIGLGDPREVDHIETGETLNNQERNLRVATRSQNNCNRRMRRDNTSGFKGVSWSKLKSLWVAQIGIDRRNVRLGFFPTKEEAHASYCEAAERLHGEFKRVA